MEAVIGDDPAVPGRVGLRLGAARPTRSAEEDKMNEKLGSGGDRGNTSQRPVAYVVSAIEGIVDTASVKLYAELTGPSIEHFQWPFHRLEH